MRRVAGVAFLMFLTACGGTAATESTAPDAIAFEESAGAADPEPWNEMGFEIGDEAFTLHAGICNVYADETFKFALAEGDLDDGGRVTATIERFYTGVDYEIIVALEGIRADDARVSWYAQDPIREHEISAVVLGGSIEGSAMFDTMGGNPPQGERASGSFWVRCG